ncbi:unnamed protein product [Paramecium primaurelia]|uniref:Transmembrane protein n=1 Tax=Paramecium primaurelia TaxID=5886 RepID=A0A8S1PKI8_PARPR|nr:unnamed protein product [Paramecium primaurelia]
MYNNHIELIGDDQFVNFLMDQNQYQFINKDQIFHMLIVAQLCNVKILMKMIQISYFLYINYLNKLKERNNKKRKNQKKQS